MKKGAAHIEISGKGKAEEKHPKRDAKNNEKASKEVSPNAPPDQKNVRLQFHGLLFIKGISLCSITGQKEKNSFSFAST